MRSSSTPGFLAGFLAMIILLGCAAGVSAAQEASPEGSYKQTCSDISVQRGTLYAKCQDAKGKAHSVKLSHYERCSDIANKDGKLECAGGSQVCRAWTACRVLHRELQKYPDERRHAACRLQKPGWP